MTCSEILDDLKDFISESVLFEWEDGSEYSDIATVFLIHLEMFFKLEEQSLTSKPKLHDSPINIFSLAEIVDSFGGLEQVVQEKKWKDVSRYMGVNQSNVATYKSLKHSYCRYIEPFLEHINSNERLECCVVFDKDIYQEIHNSILKKFSKTFSAANREKAINIFTKTKGGKQIDQNKKGPREDRYKRDNTSSYSETASDENNSASDQSETSEFTSSYKYIDAESPVYEIDDHVRVKYGNIKKLYEAVILDSDIESKPRKYFVHYVGWNNIHDEWVDETRIKHKITPQEINPKKKRGRKPKSTAAKIVPEPLVINEDKRKSTNRSTYNSLQDELIQQAIATSLEEFIQHNNSGEGSLSQSTIKEESQSHEYSNKTSQLNSIISPNQHSFVSSPRHIAPEHETDKVAASRIRFEQRCKKEREAVVNYMSSVFKVAETLDQQGLKMLMSDTVEMLTAIRDHYVEELRINEERQKEKNSN